MHIFYTLLLKYHRYLYYHILIDIIYNIMFIKYMKRKITEHNNIYLLYITDIAACGFVKCFESFGASS